MEAAGLAFCVTQTLLAALQSQEVRGLFSRSNSGSDLEDLVRTVTTIKSVLLTAESNEAQGLELSHQERNFIDNLKDAVYETDDLIDEFNTIAAQQQQQSPGKVQASFSRIVNFGFLDKTSYNKIENMRKKLNKVTDDANKYFVNIAIVNPLIIRKREETCSYISVSDIAIVGREDDHKKIVDVLLVPDSSQEDVPVLTIVGIGGMGKTALAQLVYNDPRIVKKSPLRLWVCVSDHDQNRLDVKSVLVNILKSIGESHNNDPSLEQLGKKLREKLDGNKYLLVLDDVWTENRNDWIKLKKYLSGGNKIVVTTRSEETDKAIGSSYTHKLEGLSKENSWHLFKMVVGRVLDNDHDLVKVGEEIVKKCANVPLAIKVIGNLLYGEANKSIWRSFEKTRLMDIKKDKNDIMPILKLSYHHLSSSLKSCFTYCALFPKDFVFDKEKILGLWMAQDYVEFGENAEDIAEENFQILVHRCFFQDLENNEFGEVVRFKIHDLMHDMAQQVAGKEISTTNLITSTLDKRTRHLYHVAPRSYTEGFMVKTKIRTYVLKYGGGGGSLFPVSKLLENWKSLRTLDLHGVPLGCLPDTIGQLLHLRYLDLSDNPKLERLPKSLTKLINLQFLDLRGCIKLKEFPVDLSKLVNLRTLYVPNGLEYLPLGIENMACLTRLNRFIVGKDTSKVARLTRLIRFIVCYRTSRVKQEDKLVYLKVMKNLKGSLNICFHQDYMHAKGYSWEEGYLCYAQHLNSIAIDWGRLPTSEKGRIDNDKYLLEKLQPHSNLKVLRINGYCGVKIPSRGRKYSLTSLPNLVEIHLVSCPGLKELPWLGRLQHLKTLEFSYLTDVEYMENRRSIEGVGDNGHVVSNSSTFVKSSILFFPSLETLKLIGMSNLKGWWGGTSKFTAGSGSGSGSDSGPRKDEIAINSDSNILTTTAARCSSIATVSPHF